jgi:hypothetical protein
MSFNLGVEKEMIPCLQQADLALCGFAPPVC